MQDRTLNWILGIGATAAVVGVLSANTYNALKQQENQPTESQRPTTKLVDVYEVTEWPAGGTISDVLAYEHLAVSEGNIGEMRINLHDTPGQDLDSFLLSDEIEMQDRNYQMVLQPRQGRTILVPDVNGDGAVYGMTPGSEPVGEMQYQNFNNNIR